MTTTVTPRMVVRDVVGATDQTGALVSASDRTVELSLEELGRLAVELGVEGLLALVEYFKVLRKEKLPGDREVLVLDEFSGKWLLENTSLTRNAAYRAQRAVEESGIFSRIVSNPGQGSRGRQRAVLDRNLVLIAGGAADNVDDLRVAKPGRKQAPVSRIPGNREGGEQGPVSRKVGNRESEPGSRFPGDWETGQLDATSAQVRGGLAESRQGSVSPTSDQSSSEQVLHSLRTGTTTGVAGVVPSILIPALATNRDAVVTVVRDALNDARYAERLAYVVSKLGLEGPSSQHVDLLVSVFADLIEHPETVWDTYAAMGVTKKPRPLSEDVAVERFILGVVAALGVGKLTTWGGFLGSTVRADWKPLPSASLVAFETALRAMAESAARRERLRSEAYAAAERKAAGCAGEAVRPAEGSIDDGSEADAATVDPDDAQDPALGPADLPEHVVQEHAQAAFANPDLAGFGAIGKRDNPAFVRRIVWLHLESTGQLPDARVS